MIEFDDSKYFVSVDFGFSNAVSLCAAGLKFKDPKKGLDQTLADLLWQRAENGETLTPDEMKKLAGLLSGSYIPYKCGTKKQIHTTDEQLKIVRKVEDFMLAGNTYEKSVQEVSKENGIKAGVKTIEGYITAFNKLDNETRKKLNLSDKS